ncbi:unnamed protein product [Effrenium voratum]|nr:unnamed protein product [Effrenium voratum]
MSFAEAEFTGAVLRDLLEGLTAKGTVVTLIGFPSRNNIMPLPVRVMSAVHEWSREANLHVPEPHRELMKVKNVTGSILQRMERFAPQELEEVWGIPRWDAVMILDTVARIMQQGRAQDAAEYVRLNVLPHPGPAQLLATAGLAVGIAGGAAYGLARGTGWVLENTLFRPQQGSEDAAVQVFANGQRCDDINYYGRTVAVHDLLKGREYNRNKVDVEVLWEPGNFQDDGAKRVGVCFASNTDLELWTEEVEQGVIDNMIVFQQWGVLFEVRHLMLEPLEVESCFAESRVQQILCHPNSSVSVGPEPGVRRAENNQIPLNDKKISKNHALLTLRACKRKGAADGEVMKRVFIKDSSTFGTFVNGKALKKGEWTILQEGDALGLRNPHGNPSNGEYRVAYQDAVVLVNGATARGEVPVQAVAGEAAAKAPKQKLPTPRVKTELPEKEKAPKKDSKVAAPVAPVKTEEPASPVSEVSGGAPRAVKAEEGEKEDAVMSPLSEVSEVSAPDEEEKVAPGSMPGLMPSMPGMPGAPLMMMPGMPFPGMPFGLPMVPGAPPFPGAPMPPGFQPSSGPVPNAALPGSKPAGAKAAGPLVAAKPVVMTIGAEFVGMLIGRGGEVVKQLSTEGGARIEISKTETEGAKAGERTVYISGLQDCVDKAKKLIEDAIEKAKERTGQVNPNACTLKVPHELIGMLIGRGGETIKELKKESGARIDICKEPDEEGSADRARSCEELKRLAKIVVNRYQAAMLGEENANTARAAQECFARSVLEHEAMEGARDFCFNQAAARIFRLAGGWPSPGDPGMQVCARLRPCADDEPSAISTSQVEETAKAGIASWQMELWPGAMAVFGPEVSQEVVIQRVLEPQLERFLVEPGFSSILLAYGQTGSGKTHTIFGPPGVLTEHEYTASGGRPTSWGLFPYAAIAMLGNLQQRGLAKRAQLKVTVMEIYLERMYDLLNGRQSVPVPGASVRASSNRVEDEYAAVSYDANGKWQPPPKWVKKKVPASAQPAAKEVVLETALDVVQVARQVESCRSAQSHALNARSSRSHCLITLSLRQVDTKGQLQAGQVVFVDLAGSERVGKSGVVEDALAGARSYNLPGNVKVDIPGTRFDEARSVNSSLSALGRTIAALARRDKYVCFRDSALTQMLKEPLLGAAKHITVLLALRSERSHDSETTSTMRFGAVCSTAAQGSRKTLKTKSLGQKVDTAEALKMLKANLLSVDEELQQMTAAGQDGHVNAQDFAPTTVKGFLDNKAKYEDQKSRVARYKELIAERQSELRAENGGEEDAKLQELRGILAEAQKAVWVAEGIFYRQVSTGIWVGATSAFQQRSAQRERLAQEVSFLEGASALPAPCVTTGKLPAKK